MTSYRHKLKIYSDLPTEQQFIAQVVRCYLDKQNYKVSVWKYRWYIREKDIEGDPGFAVYMKHNSKMFTYTVVQKSDDNGVYYRVRGINKWANVQIGEVLNES